MQINIKKYKMTSRLNSNLPTRTCIGLALVVQMIVSKCHPPDKLLSSG